MDSTRFHVEGIVFDLDGTIVDSKEAYRQAAAEAFSVFGKKLLDQRVALEIPRRFELEKTLNDLTQGIDVEDFRKVYLKAFYVATAKSVPYPHVSDALEKLLSKARLGLTTRRHMPNRDVVCQLEKLGLHGFFSAVVTGIETESPKPSPQPIFKCAREMGVSPSKCIAVGDSIIDIRAGKNAGAKTVAVLSGIFSRNELQSAGPDLILENVTKLPHFLI
jgi:HAD superfamily hydrolase (TIGR01509 family)